MAEKFKRWLVDDMEAGEGAELDADQTVEFGLDGKMYEIDLSTKNATRLRTDIQKYIQYARPLVVKRKQASKPAAHGTSDASGMDPVQLKAAREWLRNNGHPDLSNKGRIPRELLDKYNNESVVS
jgi:hypothetical protein